MGYSTITALPTKRELNLQADIEKLEAEKQSRGIGDGAFHDACLSMISIAKADLGAGNKSYLGTLAAQEADNHMENARYHLKKSKEMQDKASKSSKKALKAMEEATVWTRVFCALMDAGEADEETQEMGHGASDVGETA